MNLPGRNVTEIIFEDVPEPVVYLKPWLYDSCLNMIFASRGVGKTFFALKLAYALGTSQSFLHWQPGREASVLYFDGEMGIRPLRNRLAAISEQCGDDIQPDRLHVISYQDLPNEQMWNLADVADHKHYLEAVKNFDVIIIDNLLTCSRPISSTDGDVSMWNRILPLLLQLRSLKKSVILIHHAGKSGEQLGTSQRENILDYVIHLSPSKIAKLRNRQGYDLIFTKNRELPNESVKGRYVEFNPTANRVVWDHWALDDMQAEMLVRIKRKYGLSESELGQLLEMPRGRVKFLLEEYKQTQETDDESERWNI